MDKKYLVKNLYVVKLSKVLEIQPPQIYKDGYTKSQRLDGYYIAKSSGKYKFALITQPGVKVLSSHIYTKQEGEVFVSKQMPLCFTDLGKNRKHIYLSEIKAFESIPEKPKEKIYLLNIPD